MGTTIQSKTDAQGALSIVTSYTGSAQKSAAYQTETDFSSSLSSAVDKNSYYQDRSKSDDRTVKDKTFYNTGTRLGQSDKDVHSSSTTVSDKGSVKSTKQTNKDDDEEIVSDACEQIVSEIAEEFGVSEDAVEKAMQLMGMNQSDLFNSEKITQLVTQLTGETDVIEIITDENLYAGLKDVLSSVEDIMQAASEKLGITDEQFMTMIQSADSQTDNNIIQQEEADYSGISEKLNEILDSRQNIAKLDMTDANSSQNASDSSEKQTDVIQDKAVILEKDTDQPIDIKVQKTAKDGTVTQVRLSVDDKSGRTVENGNQIISEAISQDDAATNKEAGKNSRNGTDSDSGLLQKDLLDQIFSKSSVNSNPDIEFQSIASTAASEDLSTVIDQITDYMKLHIKQDMTSMEIQLHPQSLGNVNVLVSTSKTGQIVAQLTTQNEAVKTAIENQMPMLQQRFEEQGIKVDAVSVTVDNHQMDSSFGNNNRQQPSDTTEAQKAVQHRRVRQIDLNSLDDETSDEDTMDDESRIAAQIMAANGNKVDYTV